MGSGSPPQPAAVLVEGEKCVKALRAIGVVGTTSPCGAGKGEHCDWTPLAGKTIFLWPDNDENGIAHMRAVSAILEKLKPTPSLIWLDPASLDLPPKHDRVSIRKAPPSAGRI